MEALLAVQSLFFTLLFVVRSWIFRTLSEGHCGRCALHFSHALEAFCFSAKRLGDVMSNDLEFADLLFLKIGNMSYQHVCLRGYATSRCIQPRWGFEVNRCKTP